MANVNYEDYIKDLSPELQEKARACKTKEELNAFIAENDIELPEDALDLVSGGCGTSTPGHWYHVKCGREIDLNKSMKSSAFGSTRYYCEHCKDWILKDHMVKR